jgi:hypothetical protein
MTEAFTHAQALVAKLVRSGHTAYFAGGWVRDYDTCKLLKHLPVIHEFSYVLKKLWRYSLAILMRQKCLLMARL